MLVVVTGVGVFIFPALIGICGLLFQFVQNGGRRFGRGVHCFH